MQGSPMLYGQHVLPKILGDHCKQAGVFGDAGMFLERIYSLFDLPVACPVWQQKTTAGFCI